MPNVCIRVPLYVRFDTKRKKVDLDKLLDWLAANMTHDVDTEGGNPHGFAESHAYLDEAVVVDAAEMAEGGPAPNRGPQKVRVRLLNADRVLVRQELLDPNRAADLARSFVLEHGGGNGTVPTSGKRGTVEFDPVFTPAAAAAAAAKPVKKRA